MDKITLLKKLDEIDHLKDKGKISQSEHDRRSKEALDQYEYELTGCVNKKRKHITQMTLFQPIEKLF